MPVSCAVLLPNNIRLHLMLTEHSWQIIITRCIRLGSLIIEFEWLLKLLFMHLILH